MVNHFCSQVSAGGLAHEAVVQFALRRLATPTLHVHDTLLQALPEACAGYQRTPLWAESGGADISRLVTFGVINSSVVAVERPSDGHPSVVGLGAGTAMVFVRNAPFASVAVRVSDTLVGMTALHAGVVTGVTWASPQSAAGPFAPIALHEFTSETAVGWVYARAYFDDGTSMALGGISTAVSSVAKSSLVVSRADSDGGVAPQVAVSAGASSQVASLTVQTCAGEATALVNLTLPPPISVSISADRYDLVPESNVAGEVGGRRSDTRLQATVTFADGSTREMQTDVRLQFTASDACGAFRNTGGDKQLEIVASCRQPVVNVTVTAVIGGVTVRAVRPFIVEWLTSIAPRLFYKDARTAYTSSELRWRYDCAAAFAPHHHSYHSLRVRALGTLSSGASGWIGSGVTYTVGGGVLSGLGETRTLSVASAGAVSVSVAALPDPDGLSGSVLLTAIGEPDAYTFQWSLGLTASTVSLAYLEEQPTTVRLTYASEYAEIMNDDERRALLVFASSAPETLGVSDVGALQPLRSDTRDVNVSATLCGGRSITERVNVNLRPSEPFDYDLGGSRGAPIVMEQGATYSYDGYAPGDTQLCVPETACISEYGMRCMEYAPHHPVRFAHFTGAFR